HGTSLSSTGSADDYDQGLGARYTHLRATPFPLVGRPIPTAARAQNQSGSAVYHGVESGLHNSGRSSYHERSLSGHLEAKSYEDRVQVEYEHRERPPSSQNYGPTPTPPGSNPGQYRMAGPSVSVVPTHHTEDMSSSDARQQETITNQTQIVRQFSRDQVHIHPHGSIGPYTLGHDVRSPAVHVEERLVQHRRGKDNTASGSVDRLPSGQGLHPGRGHDHSSEERPFGEKWSTTLSDYQPIPPGDAPLNPQTGYQSIPGPDTRYIHHRHASAPSNPYDELQMRVQQHPQEGRQSFYRQQHDHNDHNESRPPSSNQRSSGLSDGGLRKPQQDLKQYSQSDPAEHGTNHTSYVGHDDHITHLKHPHQMHLPYLSHNRSDVNTSGLSAPGSASEVHGQYRSEAVHAGSLSIQKLQQHPGHMTDGALQQLDDRKQRVHSTHQPQGQELEVYHNPNGFNSDEQQRGDGSYPHPAPLQERHHNESTLAREGWNAAEPRYQEQYNPATVHRTAGDLQGHDIGLTTGNRGSIPNQNLNRLDHESLAQSSLVMHNHKVAASGQIIHPSIIPGADMTGRPDLSSKAAGITTDSPPESARSLSPDNLQKNSQSDRKKRGRKPKGRLVLEHGGPSELSMSFDGISSGAQTPTIVADSTSEPQTPTKRRGRRPKSESDRELDRKEAIHRPWNVITPETHRLSNDYTEISEFDGSIQPADVWNRAQPSMDQKKMEDRTEYKPSIRLKSDEERALSPAERQIPEHLEGARVSAGKTLNHQRQMSTQSGPSSIHRQHAPGGVVGEYDRQQLQSQQEQQQEQMQRQQQQQQQQSKQPKQTKQSKQQQQHTIHYSQPSSSHRASQFSVQESSLHHSLETSRPVPDYDERQADANKVVLDTPNPIAAGKASGIVHHLEAAVASALVDIQHNNQFQPPETAANPGTDHKRHIQGSQGRPVDNFVDDNDHLKYHHVHRRPVSIGVDGNKPIAESSTQPATNIRPDLAQDEQETAIILQGMMNHRQMAQQEAERFEHLGSTLHAQRQLEPQHPGHHQHIPELSASYTRRSTSPHSEMTLREHQGAYSQPTDPDQNGHTPLESSQYDRAQASYDQRSQQRPLLEEQRYFQHSQYSPSGQQLLSRGSYRSAQGYSDVKLEDKKNRTRHSTLGTSMESSLLHELKESDETNNEDHDHLRDTSNYKADGHQQESLSEDGPKTQASIPSEEEADRWHQDLSTYGRKGFPNIAYNEHQQAQVPHLQHYSSKGAPYYHQHPPGSSHSSSYRQESMGLDATMMLVDSEQRVKENGSAAGTALSSKPKPVKGKVKPKSLSRIPSEMERVDDTDNDPHQRCSPLPSVASQSNGDVMSIGQKPASVERMCIKSERDKTKNKNLTQSSVYQNPHHQYSAYEPDGARDLEMHLDQSMDTNICHTGSRRQLESKEDQADFMQSQDGGLVPGGTSQISKSTTHDKMLFGVGMILVKNLPDGRSYSTEASKQFPPSQLSTRVTRGPPLATESTSSTMIASATAVPSNSNKKKRTNAVQEHESNIKEMGHNVIELPHHTQSFKEEPKSPLSPYPPVPQAVSRGKGINRLRKGIAGSEGLEVDIERSDCLLKSPILPWMTADRTTVNDSMTNGEAIAATTSTIAGTHLSKLADAIGTRRRLPLPSLVLNESDKRKPKRIKIEEKDVRQVQRSSSLTETGESDKKPSVLVDNEVYSSSWDIRSIKQNSGGGGVGEGEDNTPGDMEDEVLEEGERDHGEGNKRRSPDEDDEGTEDKNMNGGGNSGDGGTGGTGGGAGAGNGPSAGGGASSQSRGSTGDSVRKYVKRKSGNNPPGASPTKKTKEKCKDVPAIPSSALSTVSASEGSKNLSGSKALIKKDGEPEEGEDPSLRPSPAGRGRPGRPRKEKSGKKQGELETDIEYLPMEDDIECPHMFGIEETDKESSCSETEMEDDCEPEQENKRSTEPSGVMKAGTSNSGASGKGEESIEMPDDIQKQGRDWVNRLQMPESAWVGKASNEMHEPFYSCPEESYKTYERVKRLKELKNRQPVRKRDAILAAILYIVCRDQGSPRTFSEICTASGVKRGDVGAYYRLMLKILEPSKNATASARDTDAEAFMTRWCESLSLSPLVCRAAVHVFSIANTLNLTSGKCPSSVGAAAIYLCIFAWNDARRMANCQRYKCLGCQCQTSQNHPSIMQDKGWIKKEPKDVALAVGVVSATLMGCFRNLAPEKDKLIPPEFLRAAVEGI
ncbi:Transcription initiation factor IIB, partial [Lobosporangium transversale]